MQQDDTLDDDLLGNDLENSDDETPVVPGAEPDDEADNDEELV